MAGDLVTLATEMPRYRGNGQGNSGPDNQQQYCLMKFHEGAPVLPMHDLGSGFALNPTIDGLLHEVECGQ